MKNPSVSAASAADSRLLWKGFQFRQDVPEKLGNLRMNTLGQGTDSVLVGARRRR